MAYFKLQLLSSLPKTEGDDIRFSSNLITEFYTQVKDKTVTYPIEDTTTKGISLDSISKFTSSYTRDEKLSLHINGQKELSFSMDRYVLRDDELKENPFVKNLFIGSQLLLTDRYKNQYLFTIKNIEYTFKENNVSYAITCQDSFSYQMTRQNDGYTITNDEDSEDFIGAKTIDWWVLNKIQPECHIPYIYIPLSEVLYEDEDGLIKNNTPITNCSKIIKPSYSSEDTTITIPFSASNSNANAVLISLGETVKCYISTFEKLSSNGRLIRYFWFEPQKKNEGISGIKQSPRLDIQNFNLTHAGDSLTTVLNVTGKDIGDNDYVALLPKIPSFFAQLFSSGDWENTSYSSGFFTDICTNKTLICSENGLTQKDLYISKGTSTSLNGRDLSENLTSSPITDETNTLLIPIWTESNSKLFKIPNFYDYFTFSYKDNFSSIKLFIKDSSSLIDVSASDSYLELYDLDDSNKKYDIDEDSDEIKNLDKHHNFRAYIKIKFSFDISSVSLESPDLYLTFYRNATDEEIEFAKIADQCPYLEDKLIDFSYFLNHNILSPMEYQDLMNTINNELRIVNGKLMFFAQDYLTAQKTQIKTLANIQSALDSLGGACESDIVSPIKTKGIPSSDLTTFKDKYDSIFSNTASSLAPLLNYNSLYGNYFSLYHKARQRFLKNIYNFRNYFNDRFILAGSNGSLYSYTLTLSSNNLTAEKDSSGNYITGEYSDQYITFNNNDYNLILSDFNHYVQDPNQDDYGKPTLPIYHYNNGSYTSVNVVSKDGLKAGKFFIPKISAGSYVQVKSEKYDYQTKYSLKDGNVFNPIYLIDIIKHEYDTDKSLCKWYIRDENNYSNTVNLTKDNNNNNSLVYSYPKMLVDVDNTFSININSYILQKYSNDNPMEITDSGLKPLFLHYDSYDKASYYYEKNLPINTIYVYANKYKKDGNGNLVKINELGYTKDEYNNISAQNGNCGTNPDDYKEYQEIPYINGTNASSYLQRVTNIYNNSGLSTTGSLQYTNSSTINSSFKEDMKNYSNYCFDSFSKSGNSFYSIVGDNPTTTSDKASSYKEETYPQYSIDALSYKNFKENIEKITDPGTAYCICFSNFPAQYWTSFAFKTKAGDSTKYLEDSISEYYFKYIDYLYFKDSTLQRVNSADTIDRTATYYFVPQKITINDGSEINYIFSSEDLFSSKEISSVIYYPLFDISIKINTSDADWSNNSSITWDDFLKSEFGSDSYEAIVNIDKVEKMIKIKTNTNMWTYGWITKYKTYLDKPITASSDIKSTTLYDEEDRIIDWKNYRFHSDDIYRVAATDSNMTLASYTNETEMESGNYYYYDSSSGEYKKAYTINQIKGLEDKNYYYQGNTTYTEDSLEEKTTFNNIPILLKTRSYKVNSDGSITITGETINSSNNYTFKFTNSSTIQIADTSCDIKYTGTVTLSVSSISLTQMTNGTFWYNYHNDLTHKALMEYAAAIETQLETSWTEAYTASKYCEFFLPEAWQPIDGAKQNYFSSNIIKIKKTSNSYIEASLSDIYLPQVSIYSKNGKTSLPNYNITYKDQNKTIMDLSNTFTKELSPASLVISDNPAFIQSFEHIFSDKRGSDAMIDFQAEKTGNTTYYYSIGGGTLWNDFITKATKENASYRYFDGIYPMELSILSKCYINKENSLYEKYYSQHQLIWDNIYKYYPGIILEGKYQNTDATDSTELLKMAKYYFRDLNEPERNYSISLIDVSSLRGYEGQELKIGDPIQLNSTEYYNEKSSDDVQKSLNKYLFITDIDYELRKDSDISLTINPIKYQDSIVKRLVKLIK